MNSVVALYIVDRLLGNFMASSAFYRIVFVVDGQESVGDAPGHPMSQEFVDFEPYRVQVFPLFSRVAAAAALIFFDDLVKRENRGRGSWPNAA